MASKKTEMLSIIPLSVVGRVNSAPPSERIMELICLNNLKIIQSKSLENSDDPIKWTNIGSLDTSIYYY